MDNDPVTGFKHRIFKPSTHHRALPEVRPSSAGIDSKSAGVQAASREMEALFLNYLLKEMRSTVDQSGLMSGGRAEQIYTALLDEHLSQELSHSGGIGLAQIICRQLNGAGLDERHAAGGLQPEPGFHRSVRPVPSASISSKDSGTSGR